MRPAQRGQKPRGCCLVATDSRTHRHRQALHVRLRPPPCESSRVHNPRGASTKVCQQEQPLPESRPLPSASSFAECFLSGIRQSPTLGNEVIYRVWDTRYRKTLGKDLFAECQTLVKGGARQRTVSDRLKLTGVNICRGPVVYAYCPHRLPTLSDVGSSTQ